MVFHTASPVQQPPLQAWKDTVHLTNGTNPTLVKRADAQNGSPGVSAP